MIFKKLFFETTWYMGAKIAGIISGFFVIPFMTKYLDPTDIAVYSLIIGLQLVVGTFISLQLHQPINVLFFDYEDQKNNNLITQSLATLFIISSFFLSISIFFVDDLLLLIGSKLTQNLKEVRLGIILSYLSTFSSFFEYLFRISKKSKYLFFIIFCTTIVDAIFKVYFLKLGYGITSFLMVTVFSIFASNLIQILFFRNSLTSFNFKVKIFTTSIKYCIPLIPYAFIASLSIYIDRFFLETYFTLEILGLYFIAYKVSTLTKFVANQISLSYQPFFFEKAKQDLNEAIKSAQSFQYFQVIIVLFTLIATNIFSKELFSIFLDEKFIEAYSFFLILNSSVLFRVFYNVKAIGLFYLKKTKSILLVTLVPFIVGIILNLFAINYLNFNSIPIIVLISQLISYLIIEFSLDRYIDIKLKSRLLLFSITMLGLSISPYFYFFEHTFYSSITFKAILFIVLGFAIFKVYHKTLLISTKLV